MSQHQYFDPTLPSATIIALKKWMQRCEGSRIKEVERIRRGVTLISVDGNMYIAKTSPMPIAWMSRVRRMIMGSASFQHEHRVNVHLIRREYECLNYPKMIASNGTSHMVFEYVPGDHELSLTKEQGDSLAKSLVDFQFNTSLVKSGLYSKLTGLVRGNKGRIELAKVVRAAKHTGDYKFALLVIKMWFELHSKVNPVRQYVMVHLDLNRRNVLFRQREAVILDYSAAKKCRRWLFNDVAWYSLRDDRYHIEVDLLRAYCREIHRLGVLSKCDIEHHVHYAMLVRVVYIARFIRAEVHQAYRDFFYEVLSSKKRFSKWFRYQIGEECLANATSEIS